MITIKPKHWIGLLASCCIHPLWADTLSSSYALAIQNDHSYQQLIHQNQAIIENTAIDRSQLLPNLSASGSLLTNRTNAPSGSYTNDQWNVTLQQPLINVALWQQLRSAKKDQAAAQLAIEAGRQTLMTQVAKAYFTLAGAQQTLQINQQQLRAQKKLLGIAKRYFTAGKSLRTDVSSAQAALQHSKVTIISSKNQLQMAQSDLAVITGHLATRIAVITNNPKLQPPKPNRLTTWVKQAKTANLSALSDRYKMRAAMDNIKYAESGHYPTLNASASYQNFHGSNVVTGTTDNSGTQAGLTLDVPLFSGGSVLAKTRKASDLYAASSQAWQLAVTTAANQARQAFQSANNQRQKINTLKRTINIQRQSLTDMIHAYEGGLRSMNDVLQQQTLLYQSKRELIQARYDYLLAQLNLKQATGTLTIHDINQCSQLFSRHEITL